MQMEGPAKATTAGEAIRRELTPRKRCVPAIAAAHDADLCPICDSLLDYPRFAIQQVGMHHSGPLAIAGIYIPLAVARRSPEINLQNRVTTIRQPLRVTVVTPLVTAPWTAMHKLHHRQALGFDSRGRGPVTGQLHGIAG